MARQSNAVARDVQPVDQDPGDLAVETLPGLGPKRATLLRKLGIVTVRDLLLHLPRDYQDRRVVTPIAEVTKGDTVTVRAEVVNARSIRLRGRLNLAEVRLKDDTGEIKATWFGRGFLAKAFVPGKTLLLTGEAGEHKGLALKNPDYEVLSGDEDDLVNTGRIVPVYPLTEKISQRMLRQWVTAALDVAAQDLEETLPEALLERYGFPRNSDAVMHAHFPDEPEHAEAARERFAYEELLAIQLGVLQQRAARAHDECGIVHASNGPRLEALGEALPYRLTPAQRRAVDDVVGDMTSRRPMARLIQGDVGCGKTAVALHAIAAAADSGYQTALMAPTEVLAEQHYRTLSAGLQPLGIEIVLLTGSTDDAAEVRANIAEGRTHVVVGTHALFQDATRFHKLGLAIIDEQHRFGVTQRDRLTGKGERPDVLHLTATPIPRTLAMTLYGGMDITIIDELPPGRKPVITRRVTPAKEADIYAHVAREAADGKQTYIICPLVEDSDKRALRSAVSHFEELSAGPLASLRTALLHGRLDPTEKLSTLGRFERGEIDVLFSTTVIEVGVDVPTATTIVIEDAPHFGLTQLHQLRGRVGRGGDQAHCFLLGKPETDEGRRRIAIMCETNDGFRIAEEDFLLRGPGEVQGLRQSGISDLRAADLVRDVHLLERAQNDARELLKKDPRLQAPEHAALAQRAAHFADLAL